MKFKAILLLLLAIVITMPSCSAKAPNKKSQSSPQNIAAIDTLMHNAVGDSIYRIITNAKKVSVASLPSPTDSLQKMVSKKVSSKELELMKFIASNPGNYMTDSIKYGIFLPQFQAVYKQKKAYVVLKYDFGLRKWGVFDARGTQIAMFDLASDNMLRFACKMFPQKQFFQELLLTRE